MSSLEQARTRSDSLASLSSVVPPLLLRLAPGRAILSGQSVLPSLRYPMTGAALAIHEALLKRFTPVKTLPTMSNY